MGLRAVAETSTSERVPAPVVSPVSAVGGVAWLRAQATTAAPAPVVTTARRLKSGPRVRRRAVSGIDVLDALSVVALAAVLTLIGVLLVSAARAPETAASVPIILAGLVASTLILFRQWWRGRETNRAARARLAFMLDHDAVTGLPNRAGLLKALAEQGQDGASKAAVVCVGLTRLSEINDNLGEVCGEQVLMEIASRLTAVAEGMGPVGRISEDAFALLAPAHGAQAMSLLSGRLNQLVNMPVETVAGRLGVGSALGVSFVTLPLQNPAEALRQGSLALSAAKAQGGAIAIFEPSMDASRRIELEMEAELRAALRDGELRMVYQPQINEKGGLIGVEALIRWDSEARGAVPPAIFIPIAERCGLGEAIGRFVMDRAFSDSLRWPGIKVAVNVSPVQVRNEGFVGEVAEKLKTHGVSASNIELELTEGLLLETNPTVLANLEGLRKMGFQLALDDFGTGYSGLSYLSQFQVDKIKIDRSFVIPLGARSDAAPIIRAITNLSEAIGVKVIAEGVETQLQLDTLREEGCKQAQGYHIGRPMEASAIDAMMAETRATRAA